MVPGEGVTSTEKGFGVLTVGVGVFATWEIAGEGEGVGAGDEQAASKQAMRIK